MQVVIDGQILRLDKSDVLGAGGEGTVFRGRDKGKEVAIKVYDNPTKTRGDKLTAFFSGNWDLPAGVLKPQKAVYSPNGKLIGFVMPILPAGFEEIRALANRKYRVSYAVGSKDAALIFLDGVPTLSRIHNNGLVVGDLNDLNAIFKGGKMLWIDVDSWQFGRFPCPVATEEYLDPVLYGVDLSRGPVFRPENDWYSFAVMLFKSLLLVHPYGGTHKDLKHLVQRAQRKITVFDRGVIYPKIALSPDVLDDDLAGAFHEYFAKGWRGEFPIETLRNYAESLVECTACGLWYPPVRKECPGCSAQMMLVIEQPIRSASGRKVQSEEVVKTRGRIVFARVSAGKVVALAYEGKKGIFYTLDAGGKPVRKELFEEMPGARYEMVGDVLVVNPPDKTDLALLEVSGGFPRLILKSTTEAFSANRKAVFRGSDRHLFRIAGNYLVCGEVKSGLLIERPLRQVLAGQTWFAVDSSSQEPYVFGLFQVLRQQVFWMIKEGMTYDVAVAQLNPGENVLDLSVKFSSLGVCLLRKTLEAGVEYLRRELVNGQGQVVFSKRIECSSHPNPEVHGQAYATGVILHPTDEGIIREEVETGNLKGFDETKGLVDAKDALLRSGNEILVVKPDRIVKLSLG